MDDISLLPPDKQAALLDGPALPPPPGRISRYENPPNENALSNFIVSLILALATIGLLIRVYSRLVCVKRVYFEDFLALGSYATILTLAVVEYCLIGSIGFFVHQWDVHLRDLNPFSYAIYVATNVYGVSLLCIKSAILLEWVRLFVPSGTRNAFYWLSTIGVAVNTTFYVAYIILQNLQCIPRNKIWDLTVKGKCISKYDIDIASSIINLVVDLAILVLPQQVIWKLQMSRRQRFGLSLMFAIGLVVIGVASYRLAAAITFYKSPDGLYNAPGLAFAALAEPTCVFLVFCLPTSPKVFKHIRARFRPADRSTDASPKPTRYGVETVGGTPYRKIKDDDTILLTEVTNTRNSDDGPPAGESGILRTIQFTAREEHIAGGAHN